MTVEISIDQNLTIKADRALQILREKAEKQVEDDNKWLGLAREKETKAILDGSYLEQLRAEGMAAQISAEQTLTGLSADLIGKGIKTTNALASLARVQTAAKNEAKRGKAVEELLESDIFVAALLAADKLSRPLLGENSPDNTTTDIELAKKPEELAKYLERTEDLTKKSVDRGRKMGIPEQILEITVISGLAQGGVQNISVEQNFIQKIANQISLSKSPRT